MNCDDGMSWQGHCCCNCANQVRLTRHPWNAEDMGKGSISETFGWACLAFRDEGAATFFDHEHGMCEMHMKKEGQPA